MRLKSFSTYKYNLNELLNDSRLIVELKRALEQGQAFRVKHDLDLNILKKYRTFFLKSIDINSNEYTPRLKGCKNYIQIHPDHPDQIIKANFISFSVFPWNEESNDLFETYRQLFILRNKLAGLPDDLYHKTCDEKLTARIAMQYYPSSYGFMNSHTDPKNIHQFAIPTLTLSKIGKDFSTGGFFLVNENNKRQYMDSLLNFGDLTLFHTSIPHGVEVIDAGSVTDNIEKGRMMAIAAVNPFSGIDGFNAENA